MTSSSWKKMMGINSCLFFLVVLLAIIHGPLVVLSRLGETSTCQKHCKLLARDKKSIEKAALRACAPIKGMLPHPLLWEFCQSTFTTSVQDMCMNACDPSFKLPKNDCPQQIKSFAGSRFNVKTGLEACKTGRTKALSYTQETWKNYIETQGGRKSINPF
mmetsp:Transcript_27407/g.40865  ORF Transcript_27407/g.40865 Transcript_27407/m.40865 type:complete len:160 (+) Transcript_27407:150-629(+)